MVCVELNPKGNFDPWEASKIEELHTGNIIPKTVGYLLFENEQVILWEIALFPNERIPFRRRSSNYTWTCLTKGLAISRNGNGQINLLRLGKGDTGYMEFEENEIISDLENIGEDILRITVLEYKPSTKKAGRTDHLFN